LGVFGGIFLGVLVLVCFGLGLTDLLGTGGFFSLFSGVSRLFGTGLGLGFAVLWFGFSFIISLLCCLVFLALVCGFSFGGSLVGLVF